MASDTDLSADELFPVMTAWQEIQFKRMELDLKSGVGWHAGAVFDAVPTKPTTAQKLLELRMEVASWFLGAENKYIKVDAPDTRLGANDIVKVAKQMMLERFSDTPFENLVRRKAGEVANSCLYGEPLDPRLAFGVWSGKTYPAPGNPSPRLFRDSLWDINSWSKPAYREHRQEPDYGAFLPFLAFAIPDEAQQTMLLDWMAWSLQNETVKPSWSILLFSEEKGTGKSTIGVVLEALFGAANTAKIDGIDKLVATHNDRILDKKLIVAEEVHISSKSTAGNAVKDLITSDRTTVNPKYQPTKTVPLKACHLFTTNHKPLWMEGGERRYYIIEMNHDGHAQGPMSDEFSVLVGKVFEQIDDAQRLAALYAALMSRQLSPAFDPKNMCFQANATPIMRELQGQSGNENDETLDALLGKYCVSVIPSADFKELASYTKTKNDNALRNALVRLGWENRKLRGGKNSIGSGPRRASWSKTVASAPPILPRVWKEP